jgi:hypothetical protein
LNLLEFVVTSPAAYNHFIEVCCLESTIKHHSESFSTSSESITPVFGIVQTATNIQSAFNCFPDFNLTQVIHNASQTISSTSSFKTNSIFSLFFACSIQEFSALKVSFL